MGGPAIAAVFGDTAYDVLKSVHVLCAALWVGGGFVLNVAANMAFISRDARNQSLALRTTEFIGQRMFSPIALIVVLAGVWMVVRYDPVYDFGDFWISYGIAFFVVTFVLGFFFLGPQSARAAAMIDEGASQDEIQTASRPFRAIALFDMLLLWSVVVVMVVKPGSG